MLRAVLLRETAQLATSAYGTAMVSAMQLRWGEVFRSCRRNHVSIMEKVSWGCLFSLNFRHDDFITAAVSFNR